MPLDCFGLAGHRFVGFGFSGLLSHRFGFLLALRAFALSGLDGFIDCLLFCWMLYSLCLVSLCCLDLGYSGVVLACLIMVALWFGFLQRRRLWVVSWV